MTERGEAQRGSALEGDRYPERGERRLERDADRLDGGAHDRDLVRGRPGSHVAEDLLGHEL